MARGLDYAGGRPSGQQVRAAGFDFVCRYITSGGSGLPAKQLTASEATNLRSAGVEIVSNWESTGTSARGGFGSGVSDARTAMANHYAAGGPGFRPIYFSVDWDTTPGDQTAVNDYFRGVASVIGHEWTGIYGGYWPVSRALDAGVVSWAWQCQAWSGGNQDPRINLLQQNNAGYATVGGVQCDQNISLTPDYGQWSAAKAPVAPIDDNTIYGAADDIWAQFSS